MVFQAYLSVNNLPKISKLIIPTCNNNPQECSPRIWWPIMSTWVNNRTPDRMHTSASKALHRPGLPHVLLSFPRIALLKRMKINQLKSRLHRHWSNRRRSMMVVKFLLQHKYWSAERNHLGKLLEKAAMKIGMTISRSHFRRIWLVWQVTLLKCQSGVGLITREQFPRRTSWLINWISRRVT